MIQSVSVWYIFYLHTAIIQILKLGISSVVTNDFRIRLVMTIPTMVESSHGTIGGPRMYLLDMVSKRLASVVKGLELEQHPEQQQQRQQTQKQ